MHEITINRSTHRFLQEQDPALQERTHEEAMVMAPSLGLRFSGINATVSTGHCHLLIRFLQGDASVWSGD